MARSHPSTVLGEYPITSAIALSDRPAARYRPSSSSRSVKGCRDFRSVRQQPKGDPQPRVASLPVDLDVENGDVEHRVVGNAFHLGGGSGLPDNFDRPVEGITGDPLPQLIVVVQDDDLDPAARGG